MAEGGLRFRDEIVWTRVLVEEASRMVTVARESNDAITIQDSEGRIAARNHGAQLMYGYSEGTGPLRKRGGVRHA